MDHRDVPGGHSCTQCAAGYRCTSTAAISCTPGTYSLGAYTPLSFRFGTLYKAHAWYSLNVDSLGGSTECLACPFGMRCPATHLAPQECDAGTVSVAGSANCTTCPAGKYCLKGEELSCPPGSFSLGDTKCCFDYDSFSTITGGVVAACTSCAAGQYVSSAGATSCSSCPPGKHATNDHT